MISYKIEGFNREDLDMDQMEREYEQIQYEEGHHFTCRRMSMILLNFCCLFGTQLCWKSKTIDDWIRYSVLTGFTLVEIFFTYKMTNFVQQAHVAKKATGHRYDREDITFDSVYDAVKMAIVCMIAAILCGCTGIAGGMVLGPLFMQFGMNPQVMSATNQYITMISSIAVMLQFAVLNELDWTYSGIFGATSLISAYIGLSAVKWYIGKSGKESVIALILVIVLIFALVSLPIKTLMDQKSDAADPSLATNT